MYYCHGIIEISYLVFDQNLITDQYFDFSKVQILKISIFH